MATLTASFTATGAGQAISIKHLEYMDYSVSGTFVGTVQLQRSFTNGSTWEVVLSATGAVSDNLKVENKSQGSTLYRWVCSAFTSGTIVTTLSDNSATVLSTWKNSEDQVVAQITEAGISALSFSPISGASASLFPDGSASAPGLAFSADTNTGLYRVAADTLGFAIGGSERARMDSSGLKIGASGNVVFNTERLSGTISGPGIVDNALSVGGSLIQNSDAAITTSIRQYGVFGRYRRTTTTSLTDTNGHGAGSAVDVVFTTTAATTYTNTATEGISGFLVNGPLQTGSGTLAVTHFSGVQILASSLATGTNKYGIRIGGQTGATNNYSLHTGSGIASLGDALQLRSVAAPSAVADTVQFVSEDLSAGNTIPSIVCEGTGVVGAGISDVTVTTKVAVKVNGTVYYLLATTVGT